MADAPGYDWTEKERLEDEAVWQSQSDLKRMIYSLARVNDFGIALVSPRKWRLFAVACLRRVSALFKDERTHGLIRALEEVADGEVDYQAYRRLEESICDPPYQDTVPEDDASSPLANAQSALSWVCEEQVEAFQSYWAAYAAQEATGQPEVEEQAQAALLQEIFANPFCPVLLDPNLRTDTVVALAQAAYDERSLPRGQLDPQRLTVLADALEEAGCTDPTILAHLRSPGPHVRGCWPLDQLLKKE
jgi:hypothetical protein